jgi:hypothetical protein
MQQLSAKKYIETKVRQLPIDNCYINTGWELAGMASVVVCRRHVNDHLSGAIYLVDLKCLGVKDTMYFFNEERTEAENRFFSRGNTFEVIDYNIAHNIVFAGHDFAMQYHIEPHKEFATTRFVLEEDDEKVPIIDIEVGDGPESKPHLMVFNPGHYSDVLAKLKKYAGEGNYYYTGMMTPFGDKDEAETEHEDDYDGDEDDDEHINLADLAIGGLNFTTVKQVSIDDLLNEEIIKSRHPIEIMVAKAELLVQVFNKIPKTDEHENEIAIIDEQQEFIYNSSEWPIGFDNNSFKDSIKLFNDYSGEFTQTDMGEDIQLGILERHLDKCKENLFFLIMVFESYLTKEFIGQMKILLPVMQLNGHLPLIQLELAFYHLLMEEIPENSREIIDSLSINNAFPSLTQFGDDELCMFFAIQIIRYCRNGQMDCAVAYYELLTETSHADQRLFILFIMYHEFLPALDSAIFNRELEGKYQV